ncbi:MAG: hypothetical protein LBF70_02410 [Holosporales bacterium]|jgi:NADH:ubiquinone oxidoreductase subunit 5 (subunit L)/multisubunit Na+/H+ antiporter MnhA subunit|nr:hypothetical protein [Holosporales bacterium]
MCFSILAGNVFQFYIGLEAMGIISAVLVEYEGKGPKQSSSVFWFNKLASLMFLTAICITATNNGSFKFQYLQELPAILITLSCLCKGAQIPFSRWLINATKADLLTSVLIHAATIVGVGIVFISKYHFLIKPFPYLQNVFIYIGILSALWMTCHSLMFNSVKKTIACLTASSVGLMFVACGLRQYHIAILYFISHAFSKSALFLSLMHITPKHIVWITFLLAALSPFSKAALADMLYFHTDWLLIISNIIIGIISNIAILKIAMNIRTEGLGIKLFPIWLLICLCPSVSFIYLHSFGICIHNYLKEFFIEIGQIIISLICCSLKFKIKSTLKRTPNLCLTTNIAKNIAILKNKMSLCIEQCIINSIQSIALKTNNWQKNSINS